MLNKNHEEIVINDDKDKNAEFIHLIHSQINECNKLSPKIQAQFSQSTLTFQIPSNFLPLSLMFACNFYLSPKLLDVNIIFKDLCWTKQVASIKALHPVFKQYYVGKNLVIDVINKFFTSSFSPKDKYHSIEKIFGESINIDYQNNQLFNLILEICDCFYDIQNHCCICHQKLPHGEVKPSACLNESCQLTFNEIDFGPSVAHEIKRDYHSVDLLLSMFSATINNAQYMKPKPPDETLQAARSVLYEIPSMKTISENCQNDSDIINQYGKKTLDLLRWILFSNKSQLIKLPSELHLKEAPFDTQYMILFESPEKERKFLEKKEKVKKSYFRWYGNSGEKWHSIMRNGLSDMKNTESVNIFSSELSFSLHGCSSTKNLYMNSEFGSDLAFISLCEIVPVDGEFNESGQYTTIMDDDAIIMRFIFPALKFTPLNEIRYPIPTPDGRMMLPRPVPLFGEQYNEFQTMPKNLGDQFIVQSYKYGIPKIPMIPESCYIDDPSIPWKDKLAKLKIHKVETILEFLMEKEQ
ncbi:Poly [ADP-ribose] polymerase 6 [Tritrichomonas musculus]|uniref:Poly [ADP-ribose] polymerase 6 n=1 Tax=Tritrichomonas musculus TaxID=1915356 RepID=A0ABR2KEE0_9EUKA